VVVRLVVAAVLWVIARLVPSLDAPFDPVPTSDGLVTGSA
jgi:hypothetical protein